jgi:malate dehydrogenase (oxaloacetate-decarboxylating)
VTETHEITGMAVLRHPLRNRGAACTAEQRRELRLEGLLPPAVLTLEAQARRVYEQLHPTRPRGDPT